MRSGHDPSVRGGLGEVLAEPFDPLLPPAAPAQSDDTPSPGATPGGVPQTAVGSIGSLMAAQRVREAAKCARAYRFPQGTWWRQTLPSYAKTQRGYGGAGALFICDTSIVQRSAHPLRNCRGCGIQSSGTQGFGGSSGSLGNKRQPVFPAASYQ
jgi:hypothetical protein